jgi:hypothetical protein
MSKNKKTYKYLHKIMVRLHPNNLPSAEGTWFARVNNEAILSVEQVAGALKTRGGFTGNYDDLVLHVRQFFDEMAYQLCDGFAVDTGYFTIHPNVGGAFKSPDEPPDPKNHPVSFSFHPRPLLRRLAQHIVVKVIPGERSSGSIERFLDIETGIENGKAVPGNLFSISGYRIKLKGNHPDCGIYFVSATDPSCIIKAPGPFPQNTSSKISGRIPDLPAGEYLIEIRTQYTIGGIDLKEPRASTSNFSITIEKN